MARARAHLHSGYLPLPLVLSAWKCCRAKWRALRRSKNSFHPAENASYTLVCQRTTGILGRACWLEGRREKCDDTIIALRRVVVINGDARKEKDGFEHG